MVWPSEKLGTKKQKNEWLHSHPVSSSGIPTSVVAGRLVLHMFEKRNESHHVDELAEFLYEPPNLIEIMCRQLVAEGIISKVHSGKYQYNLECRDFELQAKVEAALIDFSRIVRSYRLPCSPSNHYTE